MLPIALPGIVTGIALNVGVPPGRHRARAASRSIVAHATFCIVVVYNNVLARLRRLSPNLEEASADLGADSFQTFRYVTFPLMRTALLAGGLLAFGLSFDEIVVTTFTAGAGHRDAAAVDPQQPRPRPNQLPIVNVVATFVVLVSIIPVWVAQKLTGEAPGLAGAPLTSRRVAPAMGAELIFLVLIAVVLVFGLGVLLVSRRRMRRDDAAAARPSVELRERPTAVEEAESEAAVDVVDDVGVLEPELEEDEVDEEAGGVVVEERPRFRDRMAKAQGRAGRCPRGRAGPGRDHQRDLGRAGGGAAARRRRRPRDRRAARRPAGRVKSKEITEPDAAAGRSCRRT